LLLLVPAGGPSHEKALEDFLPRRNLVSLCLVLALALLIGLPLIATAQDATPEPAIAAYDLPAVAAGLTNPRGMTWDADRTLFVALGGNGIINLAADLSKGHAVLTGIAIDPAGGVHVGNLTPAPYVNGAAKVVHVAPDGTVTVAMTELTTVTRLAVGDDGSGQIVRLDVSGAVGAAVADAMTEAPE
jgi:hypothetical protein